LKVIEYQAARLAENPNFNIQSELAQNLLQEKAIDLLTGIIKFLNVALRHFSQTFPSIDKYTFSQFANRTLGRLITAVTEGAKAYEDGKNALQLAIREYDQAILDLTATIVAGNPI
jgi:hypothetical protein